MLNSPYLNYYVVSVSWLDPNRYTMFLMLQFRTSTLSFLTTISLLKSNYMAKLMFRRQGYILHLLQ